MPVRASHLLTPFVAVALAGAAAPPAAACSTPVFRYALLNWPPDDYQIDVFHRAPLDAPAKAALDVLRHAELNDRPEANGRVHVVDLAEQPAEIMPEPREGDESITLPWIVVRYPKGGEGQGVVWAGPLNETMARAIVDSPLRRELVARIARGDSAVWLFLEIGDGVRDDAAASLLEAELDKLAGTLEAGATPPGPQPEPTDEDTDTEPAQVAFSMIRLSRTAPGEQMLVRMLIGSEADLSSFDEPMAFPVFGRGRVLYALVGRGINPVTIRQACAYVAGGCSCQVKAQNPGTDLLIAADWLAVSAGQGSEQPSPVDAYLGLTLTEAPPADTPLAVTAGAETGCSSCVLRNSVAAVVIGLGAIALVGFSLARRGHPAQT